MTEQAKSEPRDFKVCALMSLPRYSPTHTHACVHRAFTAHGVPVLQYTGAYWHKGICINLEKAIAEGFDVAVCVDFDTFFWPQNAMDLVELLVNSDGLATMAVELKRGDHDILGRLPDKAGASVYDASEFAKPLTEMATGHFGLTAIDLKKLDAVPRPWMMATPAKDGGWGDGSEDFDIYFWRHIRSHGHKLYQANGVRIGHLVDAIMYPVATEEGPFEPRVIESTDSMRIRSYGEWSDLIATDKETGHCKPMRVVEGYRCN